MMYFQFILIFCILTSFAWSAEYHVSPSGSDSNPGTLSSPWLTVQHAADSVRAGDTVIIHAGTYAEGVVFKISGVDGAAIKFTAAQDETVSLEGMEFAKGCAYIEIFDLRIKGQSIWKVWLRGDNHHIRLKGLTVTGGETGVRITWGDSGQPPIDGSVSDIVFEDSIIENPVYTAVDCTPGPGDRMTFRNLEIRGGSSGDEPSYAADGIAVERGESILVENCYIHDVRGDGIDLNSRDTEGNISGIVVRRNRIIRTYRSGIKLWSGGRIENNVVWGTGICPVVIGIYPGAYEAVNNTIAFNMWDPNFSDRDYSFVAGYPENGVSAEIDLLLSNNIFAFNTGPQVGTPTGIYLGEGVNLIQEGNNLFWSREDCEIEADFVEGDADFARSEIGNGTWAAASGQGSGDVTSDPVFISGWPDVDLHLDGNSPAIDSGTLNNAPSVDCECMIRPAGNGCDIGAYEYGSVLDQECTGSASQNPHKKKKGILRR
jgi:hypothetical protein